MAKPWKELRDKMSPEDRAANKKITKKLLDNIEKRTELGNQIKKLLVPVVIDLLDEGLYIDDIKRTIIEMIFPRIRSEKQYNEMMKIVDKHWDDDSMSNEENYEFDQLFNIIEEYEEFYYPDKFFEKRIKSIADQYEEETDENE